MLHAHSKTLAAVLEQDQVGCIPVGVGHTTFTPAQPTVTTAADILLPLDAASAAC